MSVLSLSYHNRGTPVFFSENIQCVSCSNAKKLLRLTRRFDVEFSRFYAWKFPITHNQHRYALLACFNGVTHHLGWGVSLQWHHNERDGVSNHGVSIVYSTVCSGADQRRHQSSASLAFVRGIHWWRMNSPHKGPVTLKTFPLDDAIMMS